MVRVPVSRLEELFLPTGSDRAFQRVEIVVIDA